MKKVKKIGNVAEVFRFWSSWFNRGTVDVRGRPHNPKSHLQQRATKRIFHRWLPRTTLHKTQPRLIQRVKKGLQPPGKLLNPTVWRRLVLSLLLCPIFHMWHCTMTLKLMLNPPRLITASGLKIKRWKCTQTHTDTGQNSTRCGPK